MGQSTHLSPQPLLVEFIVTLKDEPKKQPVKSCACGSTSFLEVHRIFQPKGKVSIMYECTECGEYRL